METKCFPIYCPLCGDRIDVEMNDLDGLVDWTLCGNGCGDSYLVNEEKYNTRIQELAEEAKHD